MSKHDTRAKTLSDRLERLTAKKKQIDVLIINTNHMIQKEQKRVEILKDRVPIPRLVLRAYNNLHPYKTVTEFQMQAMLSDDVVQAIRENKSGGTKQDNGLKIQWYEGRITSIK